MEEKIQDILSKVTLNSGRSCLEPYGELIDELRARAEGSFGYSGYQYRFQVNAAASIASGPNTGYTYVTGLNTSGSTFTYELNPGITNSSDPFYQHQFGACGVPTAAQIASAVTAHEAGSAE